MAEQPVHDASGFEAEFAALIAEEAASSEAQEPHPVQEEAPAAPPPDDTSKPSPDSEAETPKAEANASVPTVDPAIEDIRLQLEEEGLRRERLEAQLAHEKMLRETQSSRAGFYKNVATDLARAIPREQDLPRFEDQGGEQSPEAARFQKELTVLREDAVTRSAQDAMTKFANEYPDAADLTEQMRPFLTKAAESYAPWLQSGDPKLVRETSMLVLKSAYLEARAEKLSQQRKAAVEKRAEQLQALTKSKVLGAITGSGGIAPTAPKRKTDSDLTAEEAASELDRLYKGR